MERDSIKPPQWNQDLSYNTTPAKALWGLIEQHSGFKNPGNAEYITGEPAFMDVSPDEFRHHDWEQYQKQGETEEVYKLHSESGPRIRWSREWNTPDDTEDRIRFVIGNVWLEVDYFREDSRAEVKFSFSVVLREREWSGEDWPRPGERQWKCNRVSTEPL